MAEKTLQELQAAQAALKAQIKQANDAKKAQDEKVATAIAKAVVKGTPRRGFKTGSQGHLLMLTVKVEGVEYFLNLTLTDRSTVVREAKEEAPAAASA